MIFRIEINVPDDKRSVREITDLLNGTIGVALNTLEDQQAIDGWSYDVLTLTTIIRGFEIEVPPVPGEAEFPYNEAGRLQMIEARQAWRANVAQVAHALMNDD